MIDLPHYGYLNATFQPNNPGGSIPGELGGPDDYMARPGYRYAIQYTLPMLNSADEAREFQFLLEKASQGEDVSYPWPLDFNPGASSPSGSSPKVSATNPAGGVIRMKNLLDSYQFKLGQPVAVISGGVGYIHRAAEIMFADGGGTIVLPVFPWTRTTFNVDDVIEIQNPRIRGRLIWEGVPQGSFGRRGFTFTIVERL
jgi:hypothetical protein